MNYINFGLKLLGVNEKIKKKKISSPYNIRLPRVIYLSGQTYTYFIYYNILVTY